MDPSILLNNMEVLMTITVTVITIAALLLVVAAILFIPAAVLHGCGHLVGMFGDICCFNLRNSQAAAAAGNSPTPISSSVTFHDHVGLEPDVLGSIPTFVFSVSGGRLECAVCLAEFKNGDKGRLLPRCGHRFHVDCIDVWFVSRSTCPLCRLTVRADAVELLV